jgi:hypothetical protein
VNSRLARFLISLIIGVLISAGLIGAAFFADVSGYKALSGILFWPNTLLQDLTPCVPIEASGQHLCEATPLNLIAYVASFPISVAVYGAIAFGFIGRRAAGRS